MSRRNVFLLGVLVLVVIYLGTRSAVLWLTPQLPGRGVVVDAVSTAAPDWVRLYNKREYRVDLTGAILTDGDHPFRFPDDSTIAGRGSLTLGRYMHEGLFVDETIGGKKIEVDDNHWWGVDEDWGFRAGELVLLVKPGGPDVMDFILTPKLDDGQFIARASPGSDAWHVFSKKDGSIQDSEATGVIPAPPIETGKGESPWGVAVVVKDLEDFISGLPFIIAVVTTAWSGLTFLGLVEVRRRSTSTGGPEHDGLEVFKRGGEN